MIMEQRFLKGWFMGRLLTLSLLFCINAPLLAANDVMNTVPQNTLPQNSNVNNSTPGNRQDWNLTETEWAKYIELIHGPAGHYFPQLTPPELLGYYAQDDLEMRHFAEIYVRIEHENVERDIKFNKAFHEAAVRLYGAEPIIKPFDLSPYTPIKRNTYQANKKLKVGDHLVLFADIKQNTVRHLLEELIDRLKVNEGVVLDVYCVNAASEEEIRNWAKSNQVPIDLVSSNRITLNNDNGKFKKIAASSSLPSVLLARGEKSEAVNVESL